MILIRGFSLRTPGKSNLWPQASPSQKNRGGVGAVGNRTAQRGTGSRPIAGTTPCRARNGVWLYLMKMESEFGGSTTRRPHNSRLRGSSWAKVGNPRPRRLRPKNGLSRRCAQNTYSIASVEFRTKTGKAWSKVNGVLCFLNLKKSLGWDKDPIRSKYSSYTCRHTFAHRMLSGYWNGGAGCSIETLAELIGDTPKVAFDHYGKEWGQHYQEPLWTAVGMVRSGK